MKESSVPDSHGQEGTGPHPGWLWQQEGQSVCAYMGVCRHVCACAIVHVHMVVPWTCPGRPTGPSVFADLGSMSQWVGMTRACAA